MDIGKRIKQLRLRNNLTLEELASRTELTKGFLSQLERNLTSPSIQTLEDIVEALGTSMTKFFAEDSDEKVIFGPKDEFTDEQENEIIHWIVPNAQKNTMEPVILELKPGAESMTVDPHEGEEMGYVLSGRLLLVRDSDRKGTMMKKGETFYIRGNESHHLENHSDKTAAVLWISTPPAF
ncbi:MAG: XRE family transcriptional regulator [Solobacterium sp.]|jgi:transcriptional regulator with XRE-family HTH domain|nr:XRE family transcriptional regulator [Solobacterium sp.]MCH4222836.1 XRE family transcriptional regulator [Solobacterium sp.]MCH4266624.1 XRE family transcriptional regulator [Solobacterium sp.]